MDITFSRLISQILIEQNINLTELYKDLNNLGINITYSSLYAYFKGTNVPPISVARQILVSENICVNDNELNDILKLSKNIQKSETEDINKTLRFNLRIKAGSINNKYELNPKLLKSVIEMRANELFGNEDLVTQYSASGKGKLSAYITYLIKNDLKKSGYIEEKNNEEKN